MRFGGWYFWEMDFDRPTEPNSFQIVSKMMVLEEFSTFEVKFRRENKLERLHTDHHAARPIRIHFWKKFEVHPTPKLLARLKKHYFSNYFQGNNLRNLVIKSLGRPIHRPVHWKKVVRITHKNSSYRSDRRKKSPPPPFGQKVNISKLFSNYFQRK